MTSPSLNLAVVPGHCSLNQPDATGGDTARLSNRESLSVASFNASKSQGAPHKALLSEFRHGISYREVLLDIAERPWRFRALSLESVGVTRKLIQFNARLREAYYEKCASESLMDRLLASIPLVGRPLQSNLFLENLKDCIELLKDLEISGLIRIHIEPPRALSPGSYHDINSHSLGFLEISVSELGKLVMTS